MKIQFSNIEINVRMTTPLEDVCMKYVSTYYKHNIFIDNYLGMAKLPIFVDIIDKWIIVKISITKKLLINIINSSHQRKNAKENEQAQWKTVKTWSYLWKPSFFALLVQNKSFSLILLSIIVN